MSPSTKFKRHGQDKSSKVNAATNQPTAHMLKLQAATVPRNNECNKQWQPVAQPDLQAAPSLQAGPSLQAEPSHTAKRAPAAPQLLSAWAWPLPAAVCVEGWAETPLLLTWVGGWASSRWQGVGIVTLERAAPA